jgi:carotenoid cleavage dioxygenase-like enzyme
VRVATNWRPRPGTRRTKRSPVYEATPGSLRRWVDLQTGAREDHVFGDGRYGGELLPIGEVDGRTLIAGLVHDVARDAAELLVLDADDLGAGPVARLLLPVRVPFGLHGAWLPGL